MPALLFFVGLNFIFILNLIIAGAYNYIRERCFNIINSVNNMMMLTVLSINGLFCPIFALIVDIPGVEGLPALTCNPLISLALGKNYHFWIGNHSRVPKLSWIDPSEQLDKNIKAMEMIKR